MVLKYGFSMLRKVTLDFDFTDQLIVKCYAPNIDDSRDSRGRGRVSI